MFHNIMEDPIITFGSESLILEMLPEVEKPTEPKTEPKTEPIEPKHEKTDISVKRWCILS